MKPRHRDRRYTRGTWLRAIDVQDQAGITYRQLDYWCRAGYLRPDDTAPGQGRERSFTAAETKVAVVMARLVEAGIIPREASRMAREITESGRSNLGGLVITEEQA